MKSLNHRFREFFSVDTVLLTEGEMDSSLAFVEVDIREGGSRRDRRVEAKSELAHHHFSLVLHDPVIQLRKRSREVWIRQYSPILYDELERSTVIHRKIFSRI